MAATQSGEEVLLRLEEAEQTLAAIRDGVVDAVMVHAESGPQVFTLASPDQPFQTFVESMQEGAITLAADGTILYANALFAAMVARLPSQLIGVELRALVLPDYEFTAQDLLKSGLSATTKGTLRLRAGDDSIPVQLTLAPSRTGPSSHVVAWCSICASASWSRKRTRRSRPPSRPTPRRIASSRS